MEELRLKNKPPILRLRSVKVVGRVGTANLDPIEPGKCYSEDEHCDHTRYPLRIIALRLRQGLLIVR